VWEGDVRLGFFAQLRTKFVEKLLADFCLDLLDPSAKLVNILGLQVHS
jgi:hypothetical protein